MLNRAGAAVAAAALLTFSASASAVAVVGGPTPTPKVTADPAKNPPPPPACTALRCTGAVQTYTRVDPVGQADTGGNAGGPAAQYNVGIPASSDAGAPALSVAPVRLTAAQRAAIRKANTQRDLFGVVPPPSCGNSVPLVACPDPQTAAAPPAAAAPAGQAPAAPPDPVVFAQRSVASLKLKAVSQGLTPLEPGSISIVGVPTWMWAENATALGTVTDTASVPGLSLTLTAKMTGVTWDMGDGTVVECEGAGTKWSPDLGTGDSPTCGHTYTKQGNYTVTSTAHWSVTWEASTGENGVIDRDLASSTATVRVGEVQVINSKGGGAS